MAQFVLKLKEFFQNLSLDCQKIFTKTPAFKVRFLFSVLKRIKGVLPPELRRAIWIVFVFMTFGSLIELLSIVALTLFFRLIYSPDFLLQFSTVQNLIAVWPRLGEILENPKNVLVWGCLIPVALIVFKNILMSMISWKSSFLTQRVSANIGQRIMKQYLYMPYSWHLSSQKALAVLAMGRRFNLSSMLLHLLSAFANLITITMLFCGLFLYAPGITIGTVFFMGLVSAGTFFILKKRIDKAGSLKSKEQQYESIATQTALDGVREIIIYQKQDVFLREITSHVNKRIQPGTFLAITSSIPSWVLESGGFFFIWATIYLMVNFSTASHAVISETIAFLALTAWRILPSLNRVVGATVSMKAEQANAMSCLDYLESLKNDINAEFAKADPVYKINGDIEFVNLSYSYPGADTESLKNINCKIQLGKTIGLVGRSGSGKTTFINILCGLLEPTHGQLLVNGEKLKQEHLAAYRMQIGYVPQIPFILGGSVAKNVAFRDWGEKIDEDRTRDACIEAAIDFLGPDCENIDRNAGRSLSGGQMQRVCIARALYSNPELLIFDEATSALDQGAEAKIQEVMQKSAGKRTNIIAAHRLETLEICDIIFWLENGELINFGPADEILGQYREALEKSFS